MKLALSPLFSNASLKGVEQSCSDTVVVFLRENKASIEGDQEAVFLSFNMVSSPQIN